LKTGRVKRLTYKADVINYWKENKIAKPLIGTGTNIHGSTSNTSMLINFIDKIIKN